MRRPGTRIGALVIAGLALTSSAAAAGPSGEISVDRFDHRQYSRGLDGHPVTATSPVDGAVWTAWTFVDRAGSDIAITTQDASGSWTDPVFFQSSDGLNQRQPDLSVDANGTVYLAYAVAQTGEIFLVTRPYTTGEWTLPSRISAPNERASGPALRIVSNRLVVAYRAGRDTVIVDLPTWSPPVSTPNGVHEGPDVIDPLGWSIGGEDLPSSGN
jgi:hypothetical protein